MYNAVLEIICSSSKFVVKMAIISSVEIIFCLSEKSELWSFQIIIDTFEYVICFVLRLQNETFQREIYKYRW